MRIGVWSDSVGFPKREIGGTMMAEYIEQEALIREITADMGACSGAPDDVQKHDEQCNYAISCIENAPTANVVPVSELVELRNWLYENGQITMRGHWCLSKLIAQYGGYGDGKT